MANEMTGLMSQIDSSFKKRGLDTTREGNNVTIQGLKKEVQDEKDRIKAEKAYNDSLTNTEYAPKPIKAPRRRTMTEMPKVNEMGDAVGYKSGGSASKRADGCAERGKTRGKMV
jgi:hypothetical protein